MILWGLALVPILAGGSIACFAGSRPQAARSAFAAMAVTSALAIAAVRTSTATAVRWSEVLSPSLEMTPMVAVAVLLVPAIAWPVIAWAAAHEPDDGLPRLVGLLVAFVGAMELLVLAADLLTLAIAWELVAGLSFLLIGHDWRRDEATRGASYAFNLTRFGGLGLWIAAGAALAASGSLRFDVLPRVAESSWGDAMAAGILLAAATKSAQVPFSPWLFRAMEGPSSVSALLHSSTMVAAGAWLLIRLHEPLALVSWFAPVTIAFGLSTALAGGAVAALQPHAKRLLAASTSAQYGLVFAAAGAGFPGAALAHLVTHAACKALLFLSAGVAISVAGSEELAGMRLGRRLPMTARVSLVGALALAAVPPLGAAWSKEQITAAAGHVSSLLAVAVAVAGGLGAWYALRFQRLAFGVPTSDGGTAMPSRERAAVYATMGILAAGSLLFGVAWVPTVGQRLRDASAGTIPEGKTWELVASVAVVAAAIAAVLRADSRGRLASPLATSWVRRASQEWLGLPAAIDRVAVFPCRSLAAACARVDAHVVDAGVRATAAVARAAARWTSSIIDRAAGAGVQLVAWSALATAAAARAADDDGIDGAVRFLGHGLGRLAERVRTAHPGAIPAHYALLAGSFVALATGLAVWR